MSVNIIMYLVAEVSRYLLRVLAGGHISREWRCAGEGPHDTVGDDVIALTLAAYLALHRLSLFTASIPRSDGPVRAILRGEMLPVQRLQR